MDQARSPDLHTLSARNIRSDSIKDLRYFTTTKFTIKFDMIQLSRGCLKGDSIRIRVVSGTGRETKRVCLLGKLLSKSTVSQSRNGYTRVIGLSNIEGGAERATKKGRELDKQCLTSQDCRNRVVLPRDVTAHPKSCTTRASKQRERQLGHGKPWRGCDFLFRKYNALPACL